MIDHEPLGGIGDAGFKDSNSSRMLEHHPIIKDVYSPIDGGHFGYGANIVVELNKSPILRNIFKGLESKTRGLTEEEILTLVEKTTEKVFTVRDSRTVDQFGAKLRQEKGIATLEAFAKEGIGFCSQSAAFEALMLEKLAQAGHLQGLPVISGFDVETPDHSEGHVYCKYVVGPTSWILDAMAGFSGPEDQYADTKAEIEWQIKRDFDS